MSATRYLELDSTYRNRKEYPEPANFVIDLGSGMKSAVNALDPVSNASPIMVFNTSFLENSDVTTTGTTIDIITEKLTDASIMTISITGVGNSLRQVKDFYVGSVLYITISSTQYSRRIVSYEPLTATQAIIRVDSPFPSSPATPITGGLIQNPTPDDTTTINKFYIPTGSFIDNFYVGYYIQNIDLENSQIGTTQALQNPASTTYRKIIAYDGTTRLATLDSVTSTNWLLNYNFVLRKQIPMLIGRMATLSVSPSTNSSFILKSTLPLSADAYTGNYIRFIQPVPTNPLSTSVTPYTREIRINSNTASEPDGLEYKCTVYLQSSFSTSASALNYEVEQFSTDNYVPLNYTGSIVSSQEMVCYEVELLNLVLPNILLQSGRGGRTAFYPYLYVELQPVSDTSAGTRGLIYSNNPHSTRMLFRAIIDDVQQPLISAFVKIGSDGMTHTMKFRPNTAFRFGVYHADGELFRTVLQDNYSPTAPNPMVQISAVFSFKRVAM